MSNFHRKSFQRTLKANVKLKCDSIFIKTKFTQNIHSLVFCEFFKDRCLVYFCTYCYELSQCFFHLLLKDIFEVCFLVSVSIFSNKQNLLDSDSAGSARWLFTNRFASIMLKTKNNNKNRKYHFEPFKFRLDNTEGKILRKLSRNFVKHSVKHSSKAQANQ